MPDGESTLVGFFGGKIIFVGSPIFPRADTHVADDLASFCMEFVHDSLVHVQVNVVDVGFDGGVDVHVANLPLPGESCGGLPPIRCRLKVEGRRLGSGKHKS